MTAGDGTENDRFGASVAIAADTIVVGAWGDENARGSASVFEENAENSGVWDEVAKIYEDEGEVDGVITSMSSPMAT